MMAARRATAMQSMSSTESLGYAYGYVCYADVLQTSVVRRA